jgi:hypothetical protein
MASEKTKTDFRGILIPDPRVTIAAYSAGDSTLTEANPKPGVPVPDGDTELVLAATGTQSAGSSYDIETLRGGHPVENGGAFVWKNSSDSATSYRGWDVPTIPTAWEAVVWTDGTGVGAGSRGTFEPHAITLSDGQVLVAHRETYFDGFSTLYRVSARRRSTAGVWSSATVFTAAYTPSGFDPCLVLLASGRVLLFHWFEDSTLEQAQIRMHYSDDKGATWVVGQELVLDEPVDISSGSSGHALGRIRAAEISGEILMTAEVVSNNTGLTYREGFIQLASDDLGASFRQIYKTDGTGGGGRFTILDVGGVFHAYFVDITTAELARYKVGSAFQSFANAAREDLIGTGSSQADTEVWGLLDGTSKFFDNVDAAAWKDENGIVYVAGRQPTITGYPAIVIRSPDNGETWAGMGQTSYSSKNWSAWFTTNDSQTYLRDFTITAQGSRAVVLHNWEATPGNEDNSLGAFYLGGWSQVTMPSYRTFSRDISRVGFERNYLPLDLPTAVGWTAVTGGTNSQSLENGYLRVTTTTGRREYTITPPGTVAEGLILRCSLKVSNSTAPGHEVTLTTRLEDGSEGYELRATFRNGGILLFDMNSGGGTQIGSTATIDCTAGVDLLVGMNDGKCSVWTRLRSTSEDRQWTNIVSDQTLADNGGGGSSIIQWGNAAASSATSDWYELHFVSDEYAGEGLAEGQTNPTDLFPRAFSPSPVWVNGGLYVSAKDGPAFRGDDWTIASRSEFPISNVLPRVSPSPREKWRSTGTGQHRIAFKFDESGPMSSVIGLYLEGINFRTGSLEGWNGSAWTSISTFDSATTLSGLPFTRSGSTIQPDTSGHTAPRYIGLDELDGATVDLGSSVYRKVSRNTAGLWTDASPTTSKPVRVHLENVDGGDPASGTAQIWSTRLLVVIRNPSDFTGYRLVIDSQSNADGYFEIGSAVVGPVYLFDRDYSWGRVLSTETNTEITTARDGTRRSRKLGPSRKAVEFGWIDGVDMQPISGANPSPDYYKPVTGAGVDAVALDGETPILLRDLVESLDGQHTPIVYIPSVAQGSPNVTQTTAIDGMLYGRISGGVRLETVQGDELEDEVTRIATITVEQEL